MKTASRKLPTGTEQAASNSPGSSSSLFTGAGRACAEPIDAFVLLLSSSSQIATMQEELAILKPDLEKKVGESQVLMEQVKFRFTRL